MGYNNTNLRVKIRTVSVVVAHFLHTEGVTGSNPVLSISAPKGLEGSGKITLNDSPLFFQSVHSLAPFLPWQDASVAPSFVNFHGSR